ncbi:MAG: hypothetical protein R2824_20710 [Saprospiraceae bacterium]|nr:hypothetical protein [Lewinella sp.]
MNIFQGNQKLEEVIFTGLDYALFSRHDLDDAFTPFMMLHKDGKSKLVRVVADGNPMDSFENMLKKDNEQYDQIVMCLEGRVPHNGEKQDAIFVKGFDTSQENGLMFMQRFRGKESGQSFQKLGNVTLIGNKEVLPVPLVNKDSSKTIEEPYLSGMTLKEESGEISRKIFAGHQNSSYLANQLFNAVLNILNKNEPNFSGKLSFNFVPNTIKLGPFTEFIFNQLVSDLKNNPTVKNWESTHGKSLKIELEYNENEVVQEKKVEPKKNEKSTSDKPNYSSLTNNELNKEYYRIISIPNGRTNISALTAMTELMAEYEKRGIEMPNSKKKQNRRKDDKPWWKFW